MTTGSCGGPDSAIVASLYAPNPFTYYCLNIVMGETLPLGNLWVTRGVLLLAYAVVAWALIGPRIWRWLGPSDRPPKQSGPPRRPAPPLPVGETALPLPAEYEALSRKIVAEALAAVVSPGATGAIPWIPRGRMGDLDVYLFKSHPIHRIKGVTTVRLADADKVYSHFAELNTSERLCASISKVDSMFVEAAVLERFAVAAPAKVQLEWAAFKVPPLRNRDFVWLEHATKTTTADGRPVFISVCSSVDSAKYPAVEGFVRGWLVSTGYVFVGPAAGAPADEKDVWTLNYVVQVDPRGYVPPFIVNLVCMDQAAVASAMKRAILEVVAADAALRTGAWADVGVGEVALRRKGSRGVAVLPLASVAAGATVHWRFLCFTSEGTIANLSSGEALAAAQEDGVDKVVRGPDGKDHALVWGRAKATESTAGVCELRFVMPMKATWTSWLGPGDGARLGTVFVQWKSSE